METNGKLPGYLEFTPLAPQTLAACAIIAQAAPDPWVREALAHAMKDARHLCLVALAAGEAVGFACFLALDDTADLEMVAVRPDMRCRGVGEALLRHSFAQLETRGVRRCLLELRASNAAARALYEKLGFVQLALRPGMYDRPPEDGILMARQLRYW